MAKVAKKKAAKKVTKKKEENLPALIGAGLDSTALASHANYDVAQFAGINLDVKENAALFSNDILIPKIWLIQALSELRIEKKAEEGQFVDSQTAEVLADEGGVLNFVVLKTFKRWHTFKMVTEKGKTKKEFVSSEIMTLQNANMAYQEVVEGDDIVRRQVISVYVLIERDAVRGANKPYIIDFAASSKYGGRKMVSDIKTLEGKGLPPFVGYFQMNAHSEKFDDGTAFVKDVKFGGYLPKESMAFLIECRKELDVMENQIEIDDRDVIDANKSSSNKAQSKVTGSANKAGAGI